MDKKEQAKEINRGKGAVAIATVIALAIAIEKGEG